MTREGVLRVARWEATELVRDPQVGFVLSASALLVYLVLIQGRGAHPPGFASMLVAWSPLGLLFLAGARKGVAHEAAFRRLVLTTPVTREEWFWGRLLGLHALGAFYFALLSPLLAIQAAQLAHPLAYVVLVLLAYALITTTLYLFGMALGARGNARAPVLTAATALALLVTGRLAFLLREMAPGAMQRTYAFLLGFFPHVDAAMLAGVAPGTFAPWWAAGLGALATLSLALVESRRRHGLGAPASHRGWALAGCILAAGLVAATASPSPVGELFEPAEGDGKTDWAFVAFVFSPLALAPAGFAIARKAAMRSSRGRGLREGGP